MSDDLKISIIANLNEKSSTDAIQKQLKNIEKNLNIQLGVDSSQLNKIASQVKDLQNKISQGSKGIKVIDDKDLIDTINQNKKLFTSIENAKDAYKSFGDIKIKKVFDPYTQELSAFNMEIKKTDGLIENLKFELAKLKNIQGADGFLLTKRTETDNREVEMQKQLQKTLVDRQAEQRKLTEAQAQAINKNIELTQKEKQSQQEVTKEIQRQLDIYQRQKQIQADNLKRRFGDTIDTPALNSNLSKVVSVDPSSFNSLKEMRNWQQEVDLGFKEIGASAKTSSSHVLSFGEAMQTAMVNNFAV